MGLIPTINENTLARKISLVEGKKKPVNIGQIKEVMKCCLDILANKHSMAQCVDLIETHKHE